MGRIREELSVANLCLDHKDNKCFYNSKFVTPACFLAWRLFWAVYHSGWLLAGIVVTSLDNERHLGKWFIYLSNWVYILLTIDSWMECGIVIKAHVNKKALAGPLPWFVKITWCLFTVTSVGAVMITLWYWTWTGKGKPVTAIRVHYHGINAVYAVANLLVTRYPYRLIHVVYPVTFGVVYTAFTAIYYAFEGTNHLEEPYIYKILDWSRPGRTFALSSLSNLVFIPVVHVLLWLLCLVIECVSKRIFSHDRIENVADSESEDQFNSV